MKKEVISDMFEGYIPVSILISVWNINKKDLEPYKLKTKKSKNFVLVQIPLSSMKFINSKEYVSALLDTKEKDESMYDHVLHISNKVRVGFWK